MTKLSRINTAKT